MRPTAVLIQMKGTINGCDKPIFVTKSSASSEGATKESVEAALDAAFKAVLK